MCRLKYIYLVIYHFIEIRRISANNKFFYKSDVQHFALFLANSISMFVLTMVLWSIYLEVFKAIKFQNVNQFRSIFTVFFVLQTRFIIYISNSRSLAPAAAAVTQKKLQQAFLLPILAGYCGVGEP